MSGIVNPNPSVSMVAPISKEDTMENWDSIEQSVTLLYDTIVDGAPTVDCWESHLLLDTAWKEVDKVYGKLSAEVNTFASKTIFPIKADGSLVSFSPNKDKNGNIVSEQKLTVKIQKLDNCLKMRTEHQIIKVAQKTIKAKVGNVWVDKPIYTPTELKNPIENKLVQDYMNGLSLDDLTTFGDAVAWFQIMQSTMSKIFTHLRNMRKAVPMPTRTEQVVGGTLGFFADIAAGVLSVTTNTITSAKAGTGRFGKVANEFEGLKRALGIQKKTAVERTVVQNQDEGIDC